MRCTQETVAVNHIGGTTLPFTTTPRATALYGVVFVGRKGLNTFYALHIGGQGVRSSVVEHFTDNEEVDGSIPSAPTLRIARQRRALSG